MKNTLRVKQKWTLRRLTAFLCMTAGLQAAAQKDTTENRIDSLLLNSKGLLGELAKNLLADSTDGKELALQRADIPFQKYSKKIIRNIYVQSAEFGVVLGDTTKRMNGALTRLANNLHTQTREIVIRNHLFFRENDRLSPYLMGNNERYLRDLPFLQEATIKVRPVRGSRDSVDVVVYTKDVFSIGGGMAFNSPGTRLQLREDNFMGWGDRMVLETMYDKARSRNFGFGAEYTRRNIAGTFIDASLGYLDFNPSLASHKKEENVAFLRFVKPLANPFMQWTYALNAEWHGTSNLFNTDSLYHQAMKYAYRLLDSWVAFNPSTFDSKSTKENDRLRYLVSARFLNQQFSEKPLEFQTKYFYPYANITALLGSVTLYRVNFYKTSYVYGFGRKEDLPEGGEAQLTTGIINKEGRQRAYLGMSYERYYLTDSKQYIDYSVRLATSVHQKSLEDMTVLANVDFFSPLHELGPRWKQRTFLNASFSTRINPLLDEPLLVESNFGLDQFQNNYVGGDFRTTFKGESVFFSPWSLLYFKFAPFAFGSATLFREMPATGGSMQLFTSLGGGIRTRNESLVFGTIEFRGAWFPRKDYFGNSYQFDISTNLRFKYRQNFIRRPEFITAN